MSFRAPFSRPYKRMSYQRTQPVFNRPYPRQRGFFRRPTANAKASRALTLIRKFKKEEERKYIDVTVNESIAAGGGATETLLNAISQGNTSTTRIGNKITMESIAWKLRFMATGAETGWLIRVMLVYDRKPAGALATWETVCTANAVLSLYTVTGNARGRFQVLYDKIFNMRDVARVQYLKGFINLKGKKGDYSLGNAGTIADLAKGSLILMANTMNTAAITDLDGSTRITFTDA